MNRLSFASKMSSSADKARRSTLWWLGIGLSAAACQPSLSVADEYGAATSDTRGDSDSAAVDRPRGSATGTTGRTSQATDASTSGTHAPASSDTAVPRDSSSATTSGATSPPSETSTTSPEKTATTTGMIAPCKVDFLFVVDNSGSMAEEQAALAASFGGFMDTVKAATGSDDFQVMVIDSDSWCDPDTKSTYKGDCRNPIGRNCDETLGAGLLKKGDGTDCGVKGANRFMNAAQADVNTVFQCLGQVGVNGSGDEKMTEAMVRAITVQNAPGGCNAGFVRSDALLVIVLLTDENDDHEAETGRHCPGLAPLPGSAGTPQTWFDAVVQVKGTESNVVVLSIVGTDESPCPGNAGCAALPNGAQTATTILDFTRRFTNGKIAPICSHDYVQFFADSVDHIFAACEAYQSPR